MSRHLQWLDRELPAWVSAGLVTGEQAERIRGRYAAARPGLPWAILIFSGLGAVIVGLGIILLFAYNWEDMPRAAKLGVIFVSLATAHFGGLRLRSQPGWQHQLGEALCLLGTMIFGAGIWLVAQIYHLQEHFPNGFLLWGLGALAFSWAAQSIPQALLAVIVLSIWNGTEALAFDAPVHWIPLGLLATIGPLAWRSRSGLLAALTLVAVIVCTLINTGAVEERLIVGTAIQLAATLLATALLTRGSLRFPHLPTLTRILGWCSLLPCLYLLTFEAISDELLRAVFGGDSPTPPTIHLYAWLPFALNLILWIRVGMRLVGSRPATASRPSFPYEFVAAPLAALLAQVFLFVPASGAGWTVAGLFNLLVLGIATAWMARGCREGLPGTTLGGALLLIALTIARYFDLFESLAWRGTIFLVVGAALFATGFHYAKARRTPPSVTP